MALGAGLGIGSVYLLASKYSQYMKKEYGDLLPSQLGTKSEREEAPPVPAVKGDQVELCGSALEQDEIIAEQLTRNIQFFGLDGQKKITESFVVVVGLGVCCEVLLLLPLGSWHMNSLTKGYCPCRELEVMQHICCSGLVLEGYALLILTKSPCHLSTDTAWQ